MTRNPQISTLFPHTPLSRPPGAGGPDHHGSPRDLGRPQPAPPARRADGEGRAGAAGGDAEPDDEPPGAELRGAAARSRSEEHTSELQSRLHLVCRLLLEKKKME